MKTSVEGGPSRAASSTGPTLDGPNDVTALSPQLLRGEAAWSATGDDATLSSSFMSTPTSIGTAIDQRRLATSLTRTSERGRRRQMTGSYASRLTPPLRPVTPSRELLMLRLMNAQLGRGSTPWARIEPVQEEPSAAEPVHSRASRLNVLAPQFWMLTSTELHTLEDGVSTLREEAESHLIDVTDRAIAEELTVFGGYAFA